MRSWLPTAGALAVGPLVVLLTLQVGYDPLRNEGAQPLVHRDGGYSGSTSCLPCHPDQHASWRRTFHRTMTQRPSPESVRGAFDGQRVGYAGRWARPFVTDGTYFMEVPTAEGGARVAEVTLTVGSRRYQQYFERETREDGFVFLRLPLLWHIVERRWLHMNTVFLFPDLLEPETMEWQQPNWYRHRDRWNTNCILCHTTGPRPGEVGFTPGPRDSPRRFDSEVAELGIACESCHGPGADHVADYSSPIARYFDHATGDNDPRVVQPARLEQERSVAVCGQCHGQRSPHDPAALLTSGPSFRPGDRLTDHVDPITRNMPEPSPSGFKDRFWGDGTPRLTAYEYQGIVASPCYERGKLTCGSCHEMHGGDPRGMIEPRMRGNAACLQCHTDIAKDVAAHTHHEPQGSGSECMECHMPRMVYGVLEIHRSHRIENPEPKRDGELGRPHACTLCHVDRSLVWSAQEMSKMWGKPVPPPLFRKDRAPRDLADGLASLLAGDALQRASYAKAMGAPGVDVRPEDKSFIRAALGLTVGDAYPSLRWLARGSLLALEREYPIGMSDRLSRWDHMDGSAPSRGTMVDVLRQELQRNGPGRLKPPNPELLMQPDFTEEMSMRQLCQLQTTHVISIGE